MTNSELKSKLDKSIEFLRTELSQIRTSRATPALIEDIEADAYGTKMKLKELGSISIMDSQNLIVSAWDRGLLPVIAKAIRESEAKLNPVAEPDRVRVPVPPLTEERRKEFAKVVSTKIEDCKNVMRGVRQDAMKEIDADFAAKKMGEDDKFKLKEDVEKVLKDYIAKVDELGESKKSDLMTV